VCQSIAVGFEGSVAVRAFLGLLIGAVLLGGCAAKPTAGGTTANEAKLIIDGESLTSKSSPSFSAGEDYERAVADYNNCVLEHTSNLAACEKQQAIMNRLGKVSARISSSQSYQITRTNTAGNPQGANTANTTQATLSHVDAVDAPPLPKPKPF
jgi:hypothetical protein